MSRLTVVGSKAVGIVGNVNLDLSLFDTGEHRKQVLALQKCKFEGATIEVGLRGEYKEMSTIDVSSDRGNGGAEQTRQSLVSISGNDLHLSTNDSNIEQESDDEEKLQAVYEQLQAVQKENSILEHDFKIKKAQLNERDNVISTELENTKVEYEDYLERIKVIKSKQLNWDQELQDVRKDIDSKQKALKAKERELTNAKYQVSLAEDDIRKEKQATDAYLKEKDDQKQKELDACKKHNDQFDSYFALSRFDNFYMSEIW